MFLLKLRELTLKKILISWIYYAAHYNTRYYLIASYFLVKPTNNRTRQKIQQNLMNGIKVSNKLRNNEIS